MASIAVIGSGAIGSTIGEAWRGTGHQVTYGSRSPHPPESVAISEAIASAEVVLLAVPGAAVPELLAAHGHELAGRLVIDATNDVRSDRWHHAEAYTASAPDARFARAFNTLGYELFAEPTIGGEQADLFWCGPDDAGVEQLVADIGLRPVRVGGPRQDRRRRRHRPPLDHTRLPARHATPTGVPPGLRVAPRRSPEKADSK